MSARLGESVMKVVPPADYFATISLVERRAPLIFPDCAPAAVP